MGITAVQQGPFAGQLAIQPRQQIVLPKSGSPELQILMDMRSSTRNAIQNAQYKAIALVNWQARGAYTTAQLKAGRKYDQLTIEELLAAEPLQYVHRTLPRNLFGQGHERPQAVATGTAFATALPTVSKDQVFDALRGMDSETLRKILAAKEAMEAPTVDEVQDAATAITEVAPTTENMTEEQLEAATNPAA